MPVIQSTKLQVIAVFVSDLERARRFYVEVLGFTLESKMDPGLLLKVGDTIVYLEGGRAPRVDAKAEAHPETCMCLDVASIDTAHRELAAAGVPMIGKLTRYSEEFAMFRVADPDGNLIEFAGHP